MHANWLLVAIYAGILLFGRFTLRKKRAEEEFRWRFGMNPYSSDTAQVRRNVALVLYVLESSGRKRELKRAQKLVARFSYEDKDREIDPAAVLDL
jgi:hypothetical protein